MKIHSFVVAISSALALTACGGGGSSGGSTAQPSTPIVKPNSTNPTNPAKVQISGESLVINTKADTDGKFFNTNTDNINTLNVDGKTFNIGSPISFLVVLATSITLSFTPPLVAHT